jgi:hypothetical protein
MRSSLSALVGFVAVAAIVTAGARADGSPYAPGLVQGASGVRAPNGVLRFVTLATERSTVVAAIRIRSGRVVRSNLVRGFYAVPIVAWDGSTGGVSGDGRTLVLASYGPIPGDTGVTSFVVLRTRTLRKIGSFRLPGSWAFDAISPDGSRIYLIEYLSAAQSPRYRVRSLDAKTGDVDPEAIVDRREDEVLMRGQPVTRRTSLDGRWAYTLYARRKDAPFVHALDTVEGEAYCIDLPLRLGQLEQMALRLKLRRDGELEVRNRRSALAVVDTDKLEARGS